MTVWRDVVGQDETVATLSAAAADGALSVIVMVVWLVPLSSRSIRLPIASTAIFLWASLR